MLQRNCAGGIVFCRDKVLLVQNEKWEWGFPKGRIRDPYPPEEVAKFRVLSESGVKAEILGMAGTTSYEFYSLNRKMPVRNYVIWYAMKADSVETDPDEEQGFRAAEFFGIHEAMRIVSYSQDKSMLMMAWQRYAEL